MSKSLIRDTRLGKNDIREEWLIMREWDGYDHPQYFKLLKLEPIEYQLDAGRLKNFIPFWKDIWYYEENTVTLDGIHDLKNLEDKICWCAANATDSWSMMPYDYKVVSFWFKCLDDTVRFKLTWS